MTVDGTLKKASYCLSEGEKIIVAPSPAPPPELVPEAIPIDVIYEDEDLVVVNKSAGMVVHPGAGNWSGTLANALLYHLGQLSGRDPLRPGIVHRLDKDTSGVLLVAKNEYAHNSLARQFKRREVEKRYTALVYGRLRQLSGRIDISIGRDTRSRIRISTRSSKPREALTFYEVTRQLPGFTYVNVLPRTGRTHQIRVHFHHLGHPIVGDKVYARKEKQRIDDPRKAEALRDLDRHFLHATFLRIVHPSTGQQVSFEAPLPTELEELLITLGE